MPGKRRTQTVVYVEDEPAVQRLVSFWLEDAGFTVHVAGDGAEATAGALDEKERERDCHDERDVRTCRADERASPGKLHARLA